MVLNYSIAILEIGFAAVEGFKDFFSTRTRVGAEHVKSGMKKNASPFVRMSSGSERK